MNKSLIAVISLLFVSSASLADDPPQLPEHVKKNTQYLTGKWTAEVEMDGEIRKVQMTVKPMLAHAGYVIQWLGPGGPGKPNTRLTAIGGWDASSQKFIETSISATGDSFSFRYKQLSETSFEGDGSGTYMGKPMTEKVSVNRSGPDEFTWSASEIVVDGEPVPDEVYRFRRDEDVVGLWLKYFAGQWRRETKIWTETEGWKSHTEEWSGEVAADGMANLYKGETSEGVQWAGMDSRYGDQLFEQGAASDGASWKITWNVMTVNTLRGRLVGFGPGGVRGEGNVSVERNDKGYVAKWELKSEDGSVMKGIETNTRK